MTVPKRYENAKYEDVPKNIQGKFEDILKTRKGIYLHGAVGTGKTHIIYALHSNSPEKLKIHPWESRVWNVTELLREIRLDFDRSNLEKQRCEEDLFDFKGILFLDDLGSERMSDWVLETFYLIVNKRYNEMLPTIFTSNFSIDNLADRIGDRITSRIVEMCDIVKIEGKDRRLPIKNA